MLFQNVSGDNLLARTVTEMGLGAGIDWAASQICAAGSRPIAELVTILESACCWEMSRPSAFASINSFEACRWPI